MRNIFTVSFYTFLEILRNKIFYSLIFFSFFIIGFGIVMTRVAIGSEIDIISDVGLGTIEIFSTLLAIFVGIFMVRNELSKKQLYPILSKAIARYEYILGKFFGIMMLIFSAIFIMSAVVFVLLVFWGGGARFWGYLPAIYTIFLQTMTVVAVSVLSSIAAEPAVGAMITISYYVIGATSYNLVYALKPNTSENMKKMINFLRYILPDFDSFNLKNIVVYSHKMSDINLVFPSFYALAITVIVLALSVALFNKKEIL